MPLGPSRTSGKIGALIEKPLLPCSTSTTLWVAPDPSQSLGHATLLAKNSDVVTNGFPEERCHPSNLLGLFWLGRGLMQTSNPRATARLPY